MPASAITNRAVSRRGAICCAIAALAIAASGIAYAQQGAKTIALMNFELIDETGDTASVEAQNTRLGNINRQLRAAFIENGLYTVVDNSPAAATISDMENRLALHDCNGCDLAIGRELNTDRVLTAWVQKVSNLILNINIRVRDVRTGEIKLSKSVDIRGNTDESWRRGVAYMIRSMVEQNQVNL
jgi:Protein of unknown function (DUF2380)